MFRRFILEGYLRPYIPTSGRSAIFNFKESQLNHYEAIFSQPVLVTLNLIVRFWNFQLESIPIIKKINGISARNWWTFKCQNWESNSVKLYLKIRSRSKLMLISQSLDGCFRNWSPFYSSDFTTDLVRQNGRKPLNHW